MERQEIINLIQKEVRREGKKLSGDIEGAINQFPNDRIMKSDDDGRLQPHASITGTELSRLEGYLDAAIVTHSTVGTAAVTSTALATAGAIKEAISNLVDGAPGALDTLNELAASLQDDVAFTTTVTNAIGGKAPTFTAGNHLTMSGIPLTLNVDTPDDTPTNGSAALITSNAVFDGLALIQAQLDLLKPSACKMYRNTNQTPNGGVGEILTYTHTEYTYGGRVSGNQGNGKFTVNTTGAYVYTGTCTYSTGVRVLLNIKVNGNYVAARQGGKPYDVDEGVTRAMSWSTDLKLSANDYVETLIWNNNSGKNVQGYSCLRWVGPT